MNNCNFCNRTILNKGSLAAHISCCKNNPNRIKHYHSPAAGRKKDKNYFNWNKGLTKETDSRIKSRKGCPGTFTNHTHSSEVKKRLSIVAKERKLGGYVKGSGRGKKGWYKGIFCDSSWELAFVIYHLDHNIEIKRCTEKRQYIFGGKIQNYIPDFVIDDKIYEIKGYKTDRWNAKILANSDIIVLYEVEIKVYIKYVIDKYGKQYINMYE